MGFLGSIIAMEPFACWLIKVKELKDNRDWGRKSYRHLLLVLLQAS
jgi:hypothetical protein